MKIRLKNFFINEIERDNNKFNILTMYYENFINMLQFFQLK